MLKTNTLNDLHLGRDISELPKTFRDAISVTRRLSVQYLWIDSLCIVQDSTEDWQVESLTMRKVYANSICNICAVASADAYGGLFRLRNPLEVQPALVQVHSTRRGARTMKTRTVHSPHYWDDQISNSNILRRGWVFQERILAPRILHFAEKQIFWECFEEQKCEGFPLGYSPDPHVPFKNLSPLFNEARTWYSSNQTPADLWEQFIIYYSNCSFTEDSDRLIALSGVARIFEERTKDVYLAGLWESTLPQSLTWHHESPAAEKPSKYTAPSWSWASTNSPVSYGVNVGNLSLVKILQAETVPSMPDPITNTGKVKSSTLVLEGLVHQAICLRPETQYFWTDFKVGDLYCSLHFYPDTMDAIANPGSSYLFLALSFLDYHDSRLSGLALRPSSESEGTYYRVGIFFIEGQHWVENFGLSLTLIGDKWVAKVHEDELLSITII